MLAEKQKETTSDNSVNQLTNEELLNVMVPAVEELVTSAVNDAVQSNTKKFDATIDQLAIGQNKLRNAMINQAAATGVMTMRGNFPDFDQYKEDVLKVMGQSGLSIEDAYLLVKAKVGSTVPPERGTHGERPSTVLPHQPARRPAGARDDGVRSSRRVSGTQDFRRLLDEGIDKTLASRG
jgi:hypothetical protein